MSRPDLKVISLWQPWATLMAINAKKFETRSKRVSHRGLICIHAAKTFPEEARSKCGVEPFAFELACYGYNRDNLPRGRIVAVATLVDVFPSEEFKPHGQYAGVHAAPHEEYFGNYEPKRFFYVMDNIRTPQRPILASGKQIFPWNIPFDVVQAGFDDPLY